MRYPGHVRLDLKSDHSRAVTERKFFGPSSSITQAIRTTATSPNGHLLSGRLLLGRLQPDGQAIFIVLTCDLLIDAVRWQAVKKIPLAADVGEFGIDFQFHDFLEHAFDDVVPL